MFTLLNGLLPILLIALPSVPIFGGVKHWYNAMPTLAILAARSAGWAAESVAPMLPEVARRPLPAVLAVLMALPGALGIAASPSTGIGYYNELAGGYRGGAELGMQRGFWGGLARPDYDRLKDLPSGARVKWSPPAR